jgi:hypothetical protein
MVHVKPLLAFFLGFVKVVTAQGPFRLPAEATLPRRWATPCSGQYSADSLVKLKGCTPLEGGKCDRMVSDDFATEEEVSTLITIAEKGMAMGGGGVLGPTIMDVNSGWVLPAGSHQPLGIYRKGPLFSDAEYGVYRSVSARLKEHIEREFGLGVLYFTAPTFITRLVSNRFICPCQVLRIKNNISRA